MPKKRVGRKVEAKEHPKVKKAESKVTLFSKFLKTSTESNKSDYRRKEEAELLHIEEEVRALRAELRLSKASITSVPRWFYIASVFAAFIFTVYISIYTTLHFEDIEFMNITIIFLFIALVSFFLVSAVYFISGFSFSIISVSFCS